MSKILFNWLGYFSRSRAYAMTRIGDLHGAENAFMKALKWFDRTENFPHGFDCLIQLGNLYKISHIMNIAHEMFDSALILANKADNRFYQAIAFLNLGMLYAIQDDFSKAQETYEEAIFLAEGNAEIKASAFHNFAILEQQRGDHAAAAKLLQEAIDAYNSVDVLPPQALVYADMGEVYTAIGDNGRARDAWNKALLIYQKENDEAGTADIQLNLGQLEGDMNRIVHAKTINSNLGRELPYANCCTAEALLLIEREEFSLADNLLQEALEIETRLGVTSAAIRDYANLALLESKRGDMEKSEYYLKEAMDIADETGDEAMKNTLGSVVNRLLTY